MSPRAFLSSPLAALSAQGCSYCRIGFSRAARLVDMMEAEGLVSASVGGKPREVLVAKDYFEEVDSQLR